MRDNLEILLQIYMRPARAFSAVLDKGSFVFAAICALLVSLPLSAAYALIPLLVVFVPAAIVILAAWDGLGSSSVAVRRDYAPLAVCALMAWTAAMLPVAIVLYSLEHSQNPMLALVVFRWAVGVGAAYFALLCIFGMRAVTGTTAVHAIVTVIAATGAAVLAFTAVGSVLSYFASPIVLYLLYYYFRPDVSSFTGGLSSRQAFRRNLEACTVNPRDADAQYQLGLIYQQRRNYTEALPRFQKAHEIDPNEADPIYQLGRIAREQGRHQDALAYFDRCAALNDKHSSSDVWRDLGATNYELGNTDIALAQLEKYVDRREYDAEGLYWLGQVYKRLNRTADAKAMFQRSIEAAQTAPSHRKQHAARWKGLSRSELRSL